MASRTQGGDLDRRITIQRAGYVANVYNEPVEVWSTLATVSARRMDASAFESYRAQEVAAQISARFTVRWSTTISTVTPLDRLIFRDGVYNIVVVRDIGRNHLREIDAVLRPDKVSELNVDTWILSTGFWNDDGVWDDSATWRDS